MYTAHFFSVGKNQKSGVRRIHRYRIFWVLKMPLFSGFRKSLCLNMNYIMQIKNRIYYLKLNYVPNLKGREFFFFFFLVTINYAPSQSTLPAEALPCLQLTHLYHAAHSLKQLTKTSLSKFLFGLARKFFLSSLVLKTTLLLGLT